MTDTPSSTSTSRSANGRLRRVPCDEPEQLVAKLRAHNVVEAWAGSYDGLFHDDLTGVNNRLAEACRAHSAM